MLLKQRISIEFADEEATEFLNIFRTCKKIIEERNNPANQPQAAKEFLTEPEARELLGNISKTLFHKLKREGKIESYHCGENRCLYAREELINYIRNNKPANK
jgi:hypothetical protein